MYLQIDAIENILKNGRWKNIIGKIYDRNIRNQFGNPAFTGN